MTHCHRSIPLLAYSSCTTEVDIQSCLPHLIWCKMINSQCLLGSLASCLQIQCSSLMTHSEFYHNSTPSASVSNWCGFCYTSCKTYSEYSLTQGYTFSSISSQGLLCLIFNYFSFIYACNT
jgi:hypothetical protein